MQEVIVQHQVSLKTTECYKCGVIFGMPSDLYDYRRNDHQNFYCPNGHGQIFAAKSEAEKLREQLAEEKRKLAHSQWEVITAQSAKEAAEKKAQKLAKRIKNGACPCCHRQFTQLTRHMASKHPEYAAPPLTQRGAGRRNDDKSKSCD